MGSWVMEKSTPYKGEMKMRRLILTSMLTAVALLAQSSSAPAPNSQAPKTPDTKAPAASSTGKVHKHSKKGSKTGKTTTAASKTAVAPAK
jgi:hypothetical protein